MVTILIRIKLQDALLGGRYKVLCVTHATFESARNEMVEAFIYLHVHRI